MLPGSSTLQRHITQHRVHRSPFAVEQKFSPYAHYHQNRQQATVEMVKADLSPQSRRFPSPGQHGFSHAGKSIVGENAVDPPSAAAYQKSEQDHYDVPRNISGQIQQGGPRFQSPTQIQRKASEERRYVELQKQIGSPVRSPPQQYGIGDTLDQEVQRDMELNQHYHSSQQVKQEVFQKSPTMVQPPQRKQYYEPTSPQNYLEPNPRGNQILSRGRDNPSVGEEVSHVQKEYYQKTAEGLATAPSSYSPSYNPTQARAGSMPPLSESRLREAPEQQTPFNQMSPGVELQGSIKLRNKKSPSVNLKARYNPTNFESLAIGSPLYAYKKNKNELITSEQMKPPYYSYMRSPGNPLAKIDGGPAYKGRDYAARYDPYRDDNLGNVRFIAGEGKASPGRRVGGAFALF